MTQSQFWILTCIIVLVVPLFFTEIFLSRLLQNDERKVMILQRIAEEGNGYSTRWEQLAVRIYQMSQQDPALKEVLVRQHIAISPKPPANPPTPAASGSPAPLAPNSSLR